MEEHKNDVLKRLNDFLADEDNLQKVKLAVDRMKKVYKKTGVDFGTLDRDSSIDYIRNLKLGGVETFYNVIPPLKNYQNWCYENGYRETEPPLKDMVAKDIIAECLEKKVVDSSLWTEKEFMDFIGKLPNARDAFISLAVYEGLRGDSINNILLLKPESIKKNGFELPDRGFVPTSKKLVELARKAQKANYYYPISTFGGVMNARALYNNGTIVKDTAEGRDLDSFLARCYERYSRTIRLEAGLKVGTVHAFENSGMINMILKEAKKLNMSPSTFIKSSSLEIVENQFGKKILNPFRLIHRFRDYLE